MAGMGGLSDKQQKVFEARLKRISKGGPNTSGHVVVGPAEASRKPKRSRRVRRPGDFLSRLGGAMGHLLITPVSFALGGAAMMAGIVGEHHVEQAGLVELVQGGMLEQAAPYKEFLLAGLVVMFFGSLLRLTLGPRKLAVVAGVAAGFILQDQIVASYPAIFTALMPETPLTLPEFAALAGR